MKVFGRFYLFTIFSYLNFFSIWYLVFPKLNISREGFIFAILFNFCQNKIISIENLVYSNFFVTFLSKKKIVKIQIYFIRRLMHNHLDQLFFKV